MNELKVFYVEDEPDLREVATLSLEMDPDMRVRTAECGPEALAALDSGEWRPDVILLDVMMPGMDGPTVLQHIRERPFLDAVPVIFITARTQPAERERFLGLGAVGVISKPFDPLTLASDLRAALARR